MSFSLHQAAVTPAEARKAVQGDDHIPDNVKTLLDEMLEVHEDAGTKHVNLATYGHFTPSDSLTIGSMCNVTCEVTVVEKVSEDDVAVETPPPDAA